MDKKNWSKRGMLGNIIGAFVILLVGFTLIPVINNQIQQASLNDSTGSKNSGIIGGGELDREDYTENIQEVKPHKQTYPEYVRERLWTEKVFGKRIKFKW